MRVEIAINPAELVTLASRVAPAPQQARGAAQPRRGGGRGGAKPKVARPKKTAEELDAEMSVSGAGSSHGAMLILGLRQGCFHRLKRDRCSVKKYLCDSACKRDMKCIARLARSSFAVCPSFLRHHPAAHWTRSMFPAKMRMKCHQMINAIMIGSKANRSFPSINSWIP